jgi:methylenetetrahydrofolate dehydrogenase (NADP+)/methenyltetrahydrofolate cyclohydrolase
MAILIKGKDLSSKIMGEIKQEIVNYDKKPTLVVIKVGNDPASEVYVAKKKQNSEEVGFNSRVIELEESISQQELEKQIDNLNNDENVNAILVQLPIPKHLDTYRIIEKILPEKDVDGFHPINVGKLAIGLKPNAVSCTPYGIIKLLEENNIEIEGKHAVIIGRSNIVGKPMSYLLLNRNATVTVCHSKTKNLPEVAKQADILIAAVGIPKFVKADWVKEGAVIIDVGINRMEDGKLVGDVDFAEVEPKAGYITPVPGGVGLMTRAVLLSNTLDLFKMQNKTEGK